MNRMDYGTRNARLNSIMFPMFVCVSLSILVGVQVYAYFWGPTPESLDGDFSDIKYVVSQLSRGLTDVSIFVNRKHELLQGELERMLSVMPGQLTSSSSTKATKDQSTEPCRPNICPRLIGDIFNYDRQMTDFAMESAGAKVLDTGDSVDHVLHESVVGWMLHVFTSWICRECIGATAMIQPGTLPGECWAFKGSKGEAMIRLLGTVNVLGFSIEHIPPHISPTREISTAPRLCQVEGLEFRGDPYPHDFGSFEYDKNGKPIQYFDVLHPSGKMYNIVRLRVLTNWGNPVYTCVYRFRVHGELAPDREHRIAGETTEGSTEKKKYSRL